MTELTWSIVAIAWVTRKLIKLAYNALFVEGYALLQGARNHLGPLIL